MPSLAFERLVLRLQQGEDSGTVAEMMSLSEGGDPDAMNLVAEYRLLGLHGKQDHKQALALLEGAAAKGHVEARRSVAYFTAAGIGRKPDWQAAEGILRAAAKDDRFCAVQLAFLQHVGCDGRLATVQPNIVSSDPYVAVIPGLFSAEECRYIQLLANPWLAPAMLVGGDKAGVRDAHRDSDGAAIVPMAEDLVIQKIAGCIAAATGTETTWGEPLSVLRYRPGQQYRPHHDAYDQDRKGAMRQKTAIIYLNDGYDGGETHFPQLGFRVRGGLGDLLVFDNLTEAGRPDPRALHSGLPVTAGEKWIATRWIRQEPYLRHPF